MNINICVLNVAATTNKITATTTTATATATTAATATVITNYNNTIKLRV